MEQAIRLFVILGVVLMLVATTACSHKRKPLVPLVLEGEVKPQATVLTEQGTEAYQSQQYEDAKRYFEQAVAEAPESGQAHYNYALALNALGNMEVARRHFLEAADLAPGDKIIWDSPALSPYGNPENKNKAKLKPYSPKRSSFGTGTPGVY
jgi:Tfp pilus assembly protein PilF